MQNGQRASGNAEGQNEATRQRRPQERRTGRQPPGAEGRNPGWKRCVGNVVAEMPKILIISFLKCYLFWLFRLRVPHPSDLEKIRRRIRRLGDAVPLEILHHLHRD